MDRGSPADDTVDDSVGIGDGTARRGLAMDDRMQIALFSAVLSCRVFVFCSFFISWWHAMPSGLSKMGPSRVMCPMGVDLSVCPCREAVIAGCLSELRRVTTLWEGGGEGELLACLPPPKQDTHKQQNNPQDTTRHDSTRHDTTRQDSAWVSRLLLHPHHTQFILAPHPLPTIRSLTRNTTPY